MRSPDRKPFLCLLLLALLAAGQCALAQQKRPVLVDSGYPAYEEFEPFWLDNTRVIFKGVEVGSYSKEMHDAGLQATRKKGYDVHGMRTGYYVWDTRGKDVRLYKAGIENLCVQDGQVIYQTIPAEDGEKSVVWRGRFGEEAPTDMEPARLTLHVRGAICWDVALPRTEAMKGRNVVRLRPEWGYLDVGPIDPPFDLKAPVLYYRADSSVPQELQIPAQMLAHGGYAEFIARDGRHLIVEGQRKVGDEPEAWFLARDGKLTEVILPTGDWSGVRLYPVRGGMFLSSVHTKGKKLSEPGGAYLIPDGQWWQLLFTGIKGRAGVSPDGCKVALTVAPHEKAQLAAFREWMAGRPGQKTMRMINVCEGAKS